MACEAVSLDQIVKDNKIVFNRLLTEIDDCRITMSPKGNTILVKKGASTVYNFSANNNKEYMTALLNANAVGMIAPSMVIYKYERLSPHVTNKMPAGWAIGKSGQLFSAMVDRK
ncbi:uncharacterized protein [Leptinotarsa decemlineata]|uniref:uncharacterized protein n=1 Tax=Leptinotarsa decemlineata TaxID=7539 RepID=UPI003D30C63D